MAMVWPMLVSLGAIIGFALPIVWGAIAVAIFVILYIRYCQNTGLRKSFIKKLQKLAKDGEVEVRAGNRSYRSSLNGEGD